MACLFYLSPTTTANLACERHCAAHSCRLSQHSLRVSSRRIEVFSPSQRCSCCLPHCRRRLCRPTGWPARSLPRSSGFAPSDSKVAVLAVPAHTAVQETFRVLDAASGLPQYASEAVDVVPYPAGWTGNNLKGDTYLLDFSRFRPTATGRYVVESNGLRSLPFEIGPAVYDVRRDRPLEFFRVAAVGCGWELAVTGRDGRQPRARSPRRWARGRLAGMRAEATDP